MSLMLPSLNSALLSLADVLPSCLASMNVAGFHNYLKLNNVRCSVLVVVDGLGTENLRKVSAHARFLSSKIVGELTTVFPSTTAAGLASLVTGVAPGSHGIVGYRVRDPESGLLINQLTGLDTLDNTDEWMRSASLLSIDTVDTHFIGHPRFETSPLTRVLYPGVSFASAYTLEDRISRCGELVRSGSSLVLLYISELDEIAHKHGVESTQWTTRLEDVDAALKQLERSLPYDVGVVVTADHGILDIPTSSHVFYGEDTSLMDGISQIGGEPRCIQLYLESDHRESEVTNIQQRWQDTFGDVAWVLTREEVIATGLVGAVIPQVYERMGHLFVLAKDDVVFYDARDPQRSGQSMIGQHGGVSTRELLIPDIRLGAYSEG